MTDEPIDVYSYPYSYQAPYPPYQPKPPSRRRSPSLRLAIRNAKGALESFAEDDTGMIAEVPIVALRWLLYGAEKFLDDPSEVSP